MTIEALTAFFMWCSIINVSLFSLWATMYLLAPDLVFRTQRRWFPLSKETWSVVMYSFLGVFKIFVLMFNVVPYVALLIIQ